jgi:hypothetical protein
VAFYFIWVAVDIYTVNDDRVSYSQAKGWSGAKTLERQSSTMVGEWQWVTNSSGDQVQAWVEKRVTFQTSLTGRIAEYELYGDTWWCYEYTTSSVGSDGISTDYECYKLYINEDNGLVEGGSPSRLTSDNPLSFS